MGQLKRQRILVTGGAGFIGGHLVELLLSKGYIVSVVDIQKPCKSFFFLQGLHKKVSYNRIDIRDQKRVERHIVSFKPHALVHLAAQPIVQEAYDHPHEAFETNIMGTVNVLEACRKLRTLKSILVASSDKAYGKTKTSYVETSPLSGDHPYDVSKSCEDLISNTYHKTYDLPVIITRFGNVYGEGDLHYDRIVPGICRSMITKKSLLLRSDGTYVRDYVYVKDVARGYLLLMMKYKTILGEAFNFSSKDTRSVVDLIAKAKKSVNIPVSYVIQNSAKNEIPYQHLNDTKIRSLGWKNRHTFSSVFPTILDWYRTMIS